MFSQLIVTPCPLFWYEPYMQYTPLAHTGWWPVIDGCGQLDCRSCPIRVPTSSFHFECWPAANGCGRVIVSSCPIVIRLPWIHFEWWPAADGCGRVIVCPSIRFYIQHNKSTSLEP